MAVPGQSMLTPESGGYFTNQTLSRQLRAVAQPLTRFRQFTKKDPQFGKRSGQKLLFNKLLNLAADPSNGAIIAAGQPIPRDGFEIRQGECVAQPSGQGIPWDEEFQVQSEFETNEPIESRALDHMAKALDYRASLPFTSTSFWYTPTGNDSATSDSSGWTYNMRTTTSQAPNVTAARPLKIWDIRNAADMMKNGRYRFDSGDTRNGVQFSPAPTWDGQSYVLIAGVETCRGFKEDQKWEEAQYYGDPEKLFTGECGRIYGIRIIEENHVLKTWDLSGATGPLSESGEAIMIAKDPAMECVTTPEEVRIDLPRDFGRDQAMAWYYLGGFAEVWNGESETDARAIRFVSDTNETFS